MHFDHRGLAKQLADSEDASDEPGSFLRFFGRGTVAVVSLDFLVVELHHAVDEEADGEAGGEVAVDKDAVESSEVLVVGDWGVFILPECGIDVHECGQAGIDGDEISLPCVVLGGELADSIDGGAGLEESFSPELVAFILPGEAEQLGVGEEVNEVFEVDRAD